MSEGQLTQITHGNLVTTTQSYDANTGRIATIAATSGSPVSKTFSYNATGNIVTKSDHGVYSYPTQGASSVRPNAVSSVVTASGTKTYAYDANGNMTSGDGRTLTWTPFNMPLAITQGASTLTFTYDTEHGRIKQVAPDGTTHYINDTSAGLKTEKFIGASSTRWVNYVYAAGGIAAVVNVDSVAGTTTRYFHKDHLGSTAVITNESGAVVERLAYDSWGKRRNTNGADDPTNSLTSLTTRGFTGHEHLQAVALVHMNGRVYDPLLGRFISADPIIQDPFDTQSINRYSYVKNNPLAYTDPNGFFSIGKFFKNIFNGIKSFLSNPRAIIGLVVAIVLQQYYLVGLLGEFWGTVAAGAIGGGITGGDLKSAIIGGVTAAAFYGVGSATDGHMISDGAGGYKTAEGGISAGDYFGSSNHIANVAGHAAVGCASSSASGGDCASGAFGAAAGAAAGPKVVGLGVAKGAVVSAVIGGTASVIGGGKFENGAMAAAFGYLFNATAVAIGGPSANNPYGHVSIATTGEGVYSFGTSLEDGPANFTDFLAKQGEYRDTSVLIIETTEQQEQRIVSVLKAYVTQGRLPDILGNFDPRAIYDTCSIRTNMALEAAGMRSRFTSAMNPFPSSTALIAGPYASESIYLRRGMPIPDRLQEFDQK